MKKSADYTDYADFSFGVQNVYRVTESVTDQGKCFYRKSRLQVWSRNLCRSALVCGLSFSSRSFVSIRGCSVLGFHP